MAALTLACTNDVSGTAVAPDLPRVQFQAQDLEADVAQILERDYRANDVQDIHCPTTAVIVGGFIRCTATIAGASVRIDLTVDNSEGRYTVGPPTAN
jgi:hypothetical protein